MNEAANTKTVTDQTSSDTPPPIDPPIDPPPIQSEGANEASNSEKKMSRSDRIMIGATIVIAVGTLVSAVAIGLQ
ncbi:MAG TPA: hypothetical protein VGU67_06395 [Edaphobacter sp.]|nr:hypothetical protein [Edaphobacter sp.]